MLYNQFLLIIYIKDEGVGQLGTQNWADPQLFITE